MQDYTEKHGYSTSQEWIVKTTTTTLKHPYRIGARSKRLGLLHNFLQEVAGVTDKYQHASCVMKKNTRRWRRV